MANIGPGGGVGGPQQPNQNIPNSATGETGSTGNVSATNAQNLAAQSRISEGSTSQAADAGLKPASKKPPIPRPNAPLDTSKIEPSASKLDPSETIALSLEGALMLKVDAGKLNLPLSQESTAAIIEAFKSAGIIGENGVIKGAGDLIANARISFTGEDGHLSVEFLEKAENLQKAVVENPGKEFSQEEFSIFSLLILMGKLQTARWDANDQMVKDQQTNYLMTFDEKAENIETKATIEFATGIGTAAITAGAAIGSLGYNAYNINSGMSPTQINTVYQQSAMIGKFGDFASQIGQSVGKRMSAMKDVEMQMTEKGAAMFRHLQDESKNLRSDSQSKFSEIMNSAMQIVTGALQAQQSISQNI